MRLRTPIAKLWINFFADDPRRLPSWVQRVVEQDQELQADLKDRVQFEDRLQVDREDWCQSWSEKRAEKTAAKVAASDTDHHPAWQAIKQPHSAAQTTPRASQAALTWQTTGVLAASIIFLVVAGLWWNRPSSDLVANNSTGETSTRQKTSASDPNQESTSSELLLSNKDLLPVLATAAATQEVATKITSSSWLLAARIGELPTRLGVQQLLLSSEDGMRSAIRRLTNSGSEEFTEPESNYPELQPPSRDVSAPPEI